MSEFILCVTSTGWSLHAPGSTDEAIAQGDAPPLCSGDGRPTAEDYARAKTALERARAARPATIHERGNGLADVGDYVAGDDGEVYRVVSLLGTVHTGDRPGCGRWTNATIELADWSDVADDEEPTCSAVVGVAAVAAKLATGIKRHSRAMMGRWVVDE